MYRLHSIVNAMLRSEWSIRTPRLELLPATEHDVDRLHRVWLAEEVRRYLWDGQKISRQTAADTVTRGLRSFEHEDFGIWTAHRIGAPGTIGFAGMLRFGDHDENVELLYGLTPDNWKRGFATEIGRALVKYGLEELGLARLYARTDLPNEASVKVMQRIGMRFESQTTEGEFGGMYCYSIDRGAFSDDA